MIEESGRVIAVENDLALIEIQRKPVCNTCSVNKGCGTGVMSQVIGNKRFRLTAKNSLNANVGDKVIVGIAEDMLVKSSFAVYIVPLLLLFVGSWCGIYIAEYFAMQATEGFSVLSGLLGLVIGFIWLRFFSQKISNDDRYRPVLLENHRHKLNIGVGPQLK